MISFGSDNHSGIHPKILKAISDANTAHEEAYGYDSYTKKLNERLHEVFGCVSSFVVFNGTGANVFALKNIVNSYDAIITATSAHINADECGAPEKHTGCKLITIDTPNGKLTPELIVPKLSWIGSEHHSQPKVISISQPTEYGTIYTPEEIKSLSDLAHKHKMYLHVDGARLANAVAALGCDPRDITLNAGVDVISLGGTKNGLMIGEVVMFFDDKLSERALFERKHLTQLYSKQRFISAQLLEYLNDNLWIELASHSNGMAKLLESKIKGFNGVKVTQSVDTNAIFVVIPSEMRNFLLQHYVFYLWNESAGEARLMTSFDTTVDDIEAFIGVMDRYKVDNFQ